MEALGVSSDDVLSGRRTGRGRLVAETLNAQRLVEKKRPMMREMVFLRRKMITVGSVDVRLDQDPMCDACN